ncbi:MAG: hypothetical protein MHPSP_001403, partial [Paramarteilia canceri]
MHVVGFFVAALCVGINAVKIQFLMKKNHKMSLVYHAIGYVAYAGVVKNSEEMQNLLQEYHK